MNTWHTITVQRCGNMVLYQLIKVSFVLLLSLSLFFLMLWPSLKKYKAGGVIIEVSTIPKETSGQLQIQELEPPALTFCARNTSYWKNATKIVDNDMVNANCIGSTNKKVQECIQEKTYGLKDTIKSAFHDATNPKSIMSNIYWTPNFGSPYLGMCHTFLYGKGLKADMMKDGLLFQLDPNLSYKVIIHDPKFYLIASNPLVFPRIWKEMKGSEIKANKFKWLYISMTEHRLLNRQEKQCEEDIDDYDFIACVKTSQAREVGCRPGWENWSDVRYPICSNMENLRIHEQMDWAIFNDERKIIVNKTGCKIPCTYKEFAVVGEQIGNADILGSYAKELGTFFISIIVQLFFI